MNCISLKIKNVAADCAMLFTWLDSSHSSLATILYWTDGGFSSVPVKRAPLSNIGNSETILSKFDASTALAMDSENGHIYWPGSHKFRRSNLDGNSIEL